MRWSNVRVAGVLVVGACDPGQPPPDASPSDTGTVTSEGPSFAWPTLIVDEPALLTGTYPDQGRFGWWLDASPGSGLAVASGYGPYDPDRGSERPELGVVFAEPPGTAELLIWPDRANVFDVRAGEGPDGEVCVALVIVNEGVVIVEDLQPGAALNAEDFAVRYEDDGSRLERIDLGDVSGDGIADLVSTHMNGDPDGWAHLITWLGPLPAEVSRTDADRDEPLAYEAYPYADSLHVVDADGDGLGDVVGGGSDPDGDDGALWWAPQGAGPTEFVLDQDGAWGHDLDLDVADLDGDGAADVVMGTGYAEDRDGAVSVFLGPFDGLRATSDADARIVAAQRGTYLGQAVHVARDADGDGAPDLLLGARGEDGVQGGRVWVYPASVRGDVRTYGTGTLEIVGPAQSELFGSELTSGDFDGDGLSDVLIGAPASGLSWLSGALYQVRGADIRDAAAR